jgi:hypothetical protein
MRRNVGRHADGDTGRSVGEEIRKGAGKDDRLLLAAVIGLAEIDGVLVDAIQKRRATSVSRASV